MAPHRLSLRGGNTIEPAEDGKQSGPSKPGGEEITTQDIITIVVSVLGVIAAFLSAYFAYKALQHTKSCWEKRKRSRANGLRNKKRRSWFKWWK